MLDDAIRYPTFAVTGPDAIPNPDTVEIMRLMRHGVPNVKNHNSAGFSIGTFDQGISGRSRLDIKLADRPGEPNTWGSVPDVTVMSLLSNGSVGIGTTMPLATLHIAGDVQIDGRLIAPRKQGYLVDQFVNHLGESLEQGDVVVIGENQVSLYYGPGNSVPIPEVDTTNRAYDTRVCGIVSEVHGEAMTMVQEQANPRVRRRRRLGVTEVRSFTPEELAQLDRTQIQPGQIGGMVTLGAFTHCKVDAAIAPIAVGDLLTTSPTRRHAQKVLDPTRAVGAILGKALAALKSGTGTIPVLVMLQ
jgi:hypothetical protein